MTVAQIRVLQVGLPEGSDQAAEQMENVERIHKVFRSYKLSPIVRLINKIPVQFF